MSQENVEVVRRVVAVLNSGDFEAIDELVDPSWEWHSAVEAPGAGVYRGRDAVKAFGYEFVEQWQEYRLEVERLIESDDRVLVLARVRARGKGSGAPIDRFIAYLNTLRNGKLLRTQVLLDRDKALEAAGVRE
jgi:ketosteroid isomerase-like protein